MCVRGHKGNENACPRIIPLGLRHYGDQPSSCAAPSHTSRAPAFVPFFNPLTRPPLLPLLTNLLSPSTRSPHQPLSSSTRSPHQPLTSSTPLLINPSPRQPLSSSTPGRRAPARAAPRQHGPAAERGAVAGARLAHPLRRQPPPPLLAAQGGHCTDTPPASRGSDLGG